jgi:hypothetical protein
MREANDELGEMWAQGAVVSLMTLIAFLEFSGYDVL